MTQTLTNRMTTNPGQAFVACSTLSIRPEDLNTQSMTEIEGGNPVLIGIGVGVAVVLLTNPQQVVDAVGWYVDRASEAIDCIAGGIAEGMVNINCGDGW